MGAVIVIIHGVPSIVDEVPAILIVLKAVAVVVNVGKAIDFGHVDPHFIFQIPVVLIDPSIDNGNNVVGIRHSRICSHTGLHRVRLDGFEVPLRGV